MTSLSSSSQMLWRYVLSKMRPLPSTSFPIHSFTIRPTYIILSGVRLSPLGPEATTGLLYQSQMTDVGYYGAIGSMKIGRGSRSITILSTTNLI
jgi:hypothetical protein